MRQTVDKAVIHRIHGRKGGFTLDHFLDLGSYLAVPLGLKNPCERGSTATEGEELTRAKTQRVRGLVSGFL
jgi:hypothetical protein